MLNNPFFQHLSVGYDYWSTCIKRVFEYSLRYASRIRAIHYWNGTALYSIRLCTPVSPSLRIFVAASVCLCLSARFDLCHYVTWSACVWRQIPTQDSTRVSCHRRNTPCDVFVRHILRWWKISPQNHLCVICTSLQYSCVWRRHFIHIVKVIISSSYIRLMQLTYATSTKKIKNAITTSKNSLNIMQINTFVAFQKGYRKSLSEFSPVLINSTIIHASITDSIVVDSC